MRHLIGVAVLALPLASVSGQDTAALPQRTGAPVVYDGDTLFYVETRIGPFAPEDRASAIMQRLARAADDPERAADTVALVESDGTTDLMLGDVVVMTVTAADAQVAGMNRDALSRARASAINAALEGESLWAILRTVLIGLAKAAVVVGVLGLAFWLMARIFPIIYRTLLRWEGTKIRALRIQRLELLSAKRATEFFVLGARATRIVLVVVLLFYAVPLVFSFFPWTETFAERILDYVVTPLQEAGTSFVNYIPSLFYIAVIVLVTRYLLKFIHLFFNGIESGTLHFRGFYKEWAQPTYKIVRFLVLAFALVVIFPYLPGSGSDAFKGVSVFFGILLSLGSASAIGNIIAGVVITYMRPFKLGDRVKIADTVGDVMEKNLLITRVRTIKNVEITIPNAMVLASHIVNYSASGEDRLPLILHTSVTIGYDVPWRRVYDLLVAAANQTNDVLEEPKPFVLQTSLDDFYVRYELNAYTDKPSAMARIYSVLHQNIQDKFAEAGVEIMSPHYGAMRDGNQIAVPPEYLSNDYRAPAFRLFQTTPRPVPHTPSMPPETSPDVASVVPPRKPDLPG